MSSAFKIFLWFHTRLGRAYQGAHLDISPGLQSLLRQHTKMWTKTLIQGKRHCLHFPCVSPTPTFHFERFKTYRKAGKKKIPLIILKPSLELCVFWSRIHSKPQTAFSCHVSSASFNLQQFSHPFLSSMTLPEGLGRCLTDCPSIWNTLMASLC